MTTNNNVNQTLFWMGTNQFCRQKYNPYTQQQQYQSCLYGVGTTLIPNEPNIFNPYHTKVALDTKAYSDGTTYAQKLSYCHGKHPANLNATDTNSIVREFNTCMGFKNY